MQRGAILLSFEIPHVQARHQRTLVPTMEKQCASVREACKSAAVAICDAICDTVNKLPVCLRTSFAPSMLKPHPEVAAWPDAVGEKVAVQHLCQLSSSINLPLLLLVDPCNGSYLRITAEGSSLVNTTDESQRQQVPPPAAATTTGQGQQAGGQQIICHTPAVWCYLDAVDGTLKLSGLFNQLPQQHGSGTNLLQPARLRVVNDGSWAVAVAFTDPTNKTLQQLQVKDFAVAAIADGNPPQHACHPVCAVAVTQQKQSAGAAHRAATDHTAAQADHPETHSSQSYSTHGWGTSGSRPLYTSSCTCLPQCFAYLDAFQAYDSRTASSTDAELAAQLYRLLIDRRNGGAFDVLRQYGNLGALLRNMLGYGLHSSCAVAGSPASAVHKSKPGSQIDELCSNNEEAMSNIYGKAADSSIALEAGQWWLEPQCGLFVVVNENLPNLVPAAPVIVGAGGVATDFEGNSLLERRLVDGRVNVVYAANTELHIAALELIQLATARSAEGCMSKLL